MPVLSRNSDLVGDVRGFGLGAADCESPFRILLIVSGGAPLPQGWSWKDLHRLLQANVFNCLCWGPGAGGGEGEWAVENRVRSWRGFLLSTSFMLLV